MRSRTSKTRSDWVWITVSASLELAGPKCLRPETVRPPNIIRCNNHHEAFATWSPPRHSRLGFVGMRCDRLASRSHPPAAYPQGPGVRSVPVIAEAEWPRSTFLSRRLSQDRHHSHVLKLSTPGGQRKRNLDSAGPLFGSAEKSPAGRGWWGLGWSVSSLYTTRH